MAGGVGTIANLLGKVSSTNALVVTFDGGAASASVFLAGDGTLSAVGFGFTTQPDSGLYIRAGDTGPTLVANGAGVLRLSDAPSVDLPAGALLRWSATSDPSAATDVSLTRGAADLLALASGDSFNIVLGSLLMGGAGGAASSVKFVKKVTAIADNTATAVLTVTVPNANHAAVVRLTFVSSNGSTDAFESSRTAEGSVVIARTTGVATVAVANTLILAAIASVAAGATHTLAYGVTAMVGAVGAEQTFTITVTIDDSGNLGASQVVVLAEVINAEATGVTIA